MSYLVSFPLRSSVKIALTGILALGSCLLPDSQQQSAIGADWADLQLTFIYDESELPKLEPVAMDKDPACVALWKGEKPIAEDLIVDPKTKGIKNMVVYPDPKKSGIEVSDAHPDLLKAPGKAAVLDNVRCIFEPHIINVRPGQTINVNGGMYFG